MYEGKMLTIVVMLTAAMVAGCNSPLGATEESTTVEQLSNSKAVTLTEENKVATELLRALLDRDFVAVEKFTGEPKLYFSSPGQLDEPFRKFLYEGNAKHLLGRERNVENFAIKIIPQEQGVFTILYTDRKLKGKLSDLKFLGTQWMKAYFACELRALPDGRFIFHENLCFAETDGPFPPEIG